MRLFRDAVRRATALALVFVVLAAPDALAGPCTAGGQPAPNLNLANNSPGTTPGCLAGVQTLSQGSEGTCWAHSHATLYEAYRRCHLHEAPAGFQASALPTVAFAEGSGMRRRANQADDAACTAANRRSESGCGNVITSAGGAVAGGSVQIADQVMRSRQNMCNQAAVGLSDGDELHRFAAEVRRVRRTIPAQLHTLKSRCESYRQAEATEGLGAWWQNFGETDPCPEYDTQLAALQGRINSSLCDCRATELNVGADVLRTALSAIGSAEHWINTRADVLIGEVMAARCSGTNVRSTTGMPALTTEGLFGGDRVNELLNQGRAVEISFCSGIFNQGFGTTTPLLQDILTRGPNLTCAQRCGCRPHSAVLIGRGTVNGQCYFRMRNSWGAGCGSYPQQVRHLCDAATGDIYIPEDVLENNVYSLSYY